MFGKSSGAIGLAILSMSLLQSCASMGANLFPPNFGPDYQFVLVSVQRPTKAAERYGEQSIYAVTDTGAAKYAFEDSMVKLVAYVAEDRVVFTLANKLHTSVKIIWNEAALSGIDGTSSGVMHVGMRYMDCASPKTPSVVIGGGSTTDDAIPCNHLQSPSVGSSWHVQPLSGLPHSAQISDTSQLMMSARHLVGKRIQLLLPLQVEDVVNEYVLSFEVKSVSMSSRGFAGAP